MTWDVQLSPPLVVAMTAAPLGAPAPPTVEPTAQQDVSVGQSTAVIELTGAGGRTAVKAPSQGEPAAMVDGSGPAVEENVQAPAERTISADTATIRPRQRVVIRREVPTPFPTGPPFGN
jgi:hypothetical protein